MSPVTRLSHVTCRAIVADSQLLLQQQLVPASCWRQGQCWHFAGLCWASPRCIHASIRGKSTYGAVCASAVNLFSAPLLVMQVYSPLHQRRLLAAMNRLVLGAGLWPSPPQVRIT